MTLDATLEAILFALAQPVSMKRLAELTGEKIDAVKEGLDALRGRLENGEGGTRLLVHGNDAELVTHPDAAKAVREAMRQDIHGELTRPSLEALAILAYRGPLTRPELEQIRGVQSALILRNLMLRGLVEQAEDERLGQPLYGVTADFLKAIGTERLEMLPEYEELHVNRAVEQVLEELTPHQEESAGVSGGQQIKV